MTKTKSDRVIVTNKEHHMAICQELNELYARKNADYGDSFHQSYIEEGLAMARIRLGDKLARFKTLTRKDTQEVKDESIRDTLLDLANYAIMTVMELDWADYASYCSSDLPKESWSENVKKLYGFIKDDLFDS